ncbi:tRNA uridine-5-carboxymethylaminomethyl(34) synthesis GTPase MnmE [Treponema sp. OMZ 840]|uniref:tRNA uridine-5-carboxymethylaminomethyl(34) synthesis GTPase MnmE n=1 Tax=Treponema sp. OMZ 840 TaxID=244313 RepID=UPI003D933ACC
MKRYAPNEAVAAVATALGPSALAVIRTSGADCIKLVSTVFSRSQTLLKAEGNSLVYGWIQNGTEKIDEVMLGVYRAPKSFTGEDMVEIFCHGGTSPVLAVYRLLLQNGFRAAEPGEFSFRAFINGKTDLTRAEAVKEIIDSKTEVSRSRACGRLAGSLYEELAEIKKAVIFALSGLEADIEYPEDENAVSGAFDPAHLIEARDKLASLISSWECEKLYQDGVRMVLCGRTNAGKSSLFNALLKEERAIVSDIHGTTRDWIESWLSFGGIPVRLFDTAGLRETEDIVEKAGVERTMDLSSEADILLYLIDSSQGAAEEDKRAIERLAQHGKPLVIVWNKIDKVKTAAQSETLQSAPDAEKGGAFNGTAQVRVSAKNGQGIDDLTETVQKLLFAGIHTERGQSGFGSLRQKQAADEALESLNHAIAVPDTGLSLDAAVQDMEDALAFLGEITGEVSPDDILENIFSRFCVGK